MVILLYVPKAPGDLRPTHSTNPKGKTMNDWDDKLTARAARARTVFRASETNPMYIPRHCWVCSEYLVRFFSEAENDTLYVCANDDCPESGAEITCCLCSEIVNTLNTLEYHVVADANRHATVCMRCYNTLEPSDATHEMLLSLREQTYANDHPVYSVPASALNDMPSLAEPPF